MATILEIESGAGLVELGEIEALARAFGLTLPALLVPPGLSGYVSLTQLT